MGLFNKLISLNVGIAFEASEGILAIRRLIEKNASFSFTNTPEFIIKEFSDLFVGKNVKVHKLKEQKLSDDIDSIVNVESSSTRIESCFCGINASLCTVSFGTRYTFNIVYSDGVIHDINQINMVKCLKCLGRNNMHNSHAREKLFFGGTYSVSSGLEKIMEVLETSEKISVNNPPDFFLAELIELFNKRDKKNVKILAAASTSLKKELKTFPNARLLPKYINTEVIYRGLDCQPGGIATECVHFGYAWLNDEIFDIRTAEWEKCTECMFNIYNAVWLISKRVRG